LVLLAALLPFAGVRDFDHVWDDHVFRGPGSLALSPDVSWTTLLGADLFAQPGTSDAGSGLWRPLVLASYRVEAQLAGSSRAGFLWLGHVGTLLLHALASLALFGLLRRLQLGVGAALLGATLFAVHPVHAEPVSWLSGRMDVGGTAAGLLALGLALRGSRAADVGAALLLVAALLCKETAIVFLPLAALLAHSRGRSLRVSLALPTLALLGYLALRAELYEGRVVPGAGLADAESWWTGLAAIPSQLRLMLWPGAPSPLHPLASRAAPDPAVFAGLGALALLAGLSWHAWRRRNGAGVLAFGVLALGLASLLPWVAPTARADLAGPLNERYLYALSIAPCVGLAWIVRRAQLARLPWAVAGSVGLLLVLGPVTAARSEVWRDDAAFVEAGLRRLPEHPDLWVQRGDAALQAYAADQDPAHLERALQSFETALTHDPEHLVAAVNRFIVVATLGQDEKAAFLAAKLAEGWPEEPLVLFNLAAWHAEQGRPVEARKLLNRDLAAEPWHPRSRDLLRELR